jgi:hypothetical protein
MNYKQMLDKLQELEARIRVLENEQKKSLDFFRGVPVPRPDPFPVPFTPQTDPWKKDKEVYNWKECSVCGNKGVTGYVCCRADCPTAVTCETNPQDGFR